MTFEEWKKTEIGLKAQEWPIVATHPETYLHNRLYMAFEAGRNEGAGDTSLNTTLQWYESKLTKLKAELKDCKKQLKEYSDKFDV